MTSFQVCHEEVIGHAVSSLQSGMLELNSHSCSDRALIAPWEANALYLTKNIIGISHLFTFP